MANPRLFRTTPGSLIDAPLGAYSAPHTVRPSLIRNPIQANIDAGKRSIGGTINPETNAFTPLPTYQPGPTPGTPVGRPAPGAPVVAATPAPTAAPPPPVPAAPALARPNRFTTGDGRSATLPAGIAVAPYTLPDGSKANAFAGSADSIAAAKRAGVAGQGFGGNQANDTGSYAAPPLTRPQPYIAPSTNLDGNRGAADAERRTAISDLDSRLSALGTLDSRGKRAMAGQILELKTGLVRGAYDQQGDLAKAGAQINASGATAALGANASADESTARINAGAAEGGLQRKLQFDTSGNPIVGKDGKLSLQRGNTATPVLGPDGKPFEGQATKQGGLTPDAILKAYTDQLNGIDPLDPNAGALRQEAQAKIDALIGGGQAVAKPALADFLAKAKAANPGRSDAELTAYYNKTYGQ